MPQVNSSCQCFEQSTTYANLIVKYKSQGFIDLKWPNLSFPKTDFVSKSKGLGSGFGSLTLYL